MKGKDNEKKRKEKNHLRFVDWQLLPSVGRTDARAEDADGPPAQLAPSAGVSARTNGRTSLIRDNYAVAPYGFLTVTESHHDTSFVIEEKVPARSHTALPPPVGSVLKLVDNGHGVMGKAKVRLIAGWMASTETKSLLRDR
ncbi:hypothetical protein L249_6099 [Ophiocordyceps polyrhachis-furcata BCC 54312]|uniref:Uncharacterized protein n=1 Tax=Ophiocordyceps polyrhachis-furcata BCC 54312 TaxID=1330021 RepID=A0A367LJ88_9HYPO|nr:hypothetical protein L249_6099 [Ophiocordyceps polyrhachis-furcata BCC 54312]